MNAPKLLYPILVIVLGVCMFLYGDYDDSPGGQLLGVIAVIIGLTSIVRNRQKDTE